MKGVAEVGQFFKRIIKDKRFYIITVFLLFSLSLAVVSPAFPVSSAPLGYAGDTPKSFSGNGTVIYGEKDHQYSSDGWKDFSADTNMAYIFSAWYSYHWRDSGVGKATITGDKARMLLYELSILKPLDERVGSVEDIGGKSINNTQWIQTVDKYYRIPNDREGVIYLMDEYGDANGKGSVYALTDDLKALVDELYSGKGKNDSFHGDLEGETLKVHMSYDGKSTNSLIFTDVVREKNEEGKYSGGYLKCTFIASESGKYTVSHSIFYSEDNFGPRDSITFDAKKGQPVTVKVPLDNTTRYYDMNISCGGVYYYIYVHSH